MLNNLTPCIKEPPPLHYHCCFDVNFSLIALLIGEKSRFLKVEIMSSEVSVEMEVSEELSRDEVSFVNLNKAQTFNGESGKSICVFI